MARSAVWPASVGSQLAQLQWIQLGALTQHAILVMLPQPLTQTPHVPGDCSVQS